MIKFKILKEVKHNNCRDIYCNLSRGDLFSIREAERASEASKKIFCTKKHSLLLENSHGYCQWISDFDLNNLIRLKYIQVLK